MRATIHWYPSLLLTLLMSVSQETEDELVSLISFYAYHRSQDVINAGLLPILSRLVGAKRLRLSQPLINLINNLALGGYGSYEEGGVEEPLDLNSADGDVREGGDAHDDSSSSSDSQYTDSSRSFCLFIIPLLIHSYQAEMLTLSIFLSSAYNLIKQMAAPDLSTVFKALLNQPSANSSRAIHCIILTLKDSVIKTDLISLVFDHLLSMEELPLPLPVAEWYLNVLTNFLGSYLTLDIFGIPKLTLLVSRYPSAHVLYCHIAQLIKVPSSCAALPRLLVESGLITACITTNPSSLPLSGVLVQERLCCLLEITNSVLTSGDTEVVDSLLSNGVIVSHLVVSYEGMTNLLTRIGIINCLKKIVAIQPRYLEEIVQRNDCSEALKEALLGQAVPPPPMAASATRVGKRKYR
jgi:hypothetical protein